MDHALAYYAPEAEPTAAFVQLKSRIGKWSNDAVLAYAAADHFEGEITDAERDELVELVSEAQS